MAATQEERCAEIDLDLSWSEADLPERERTKHVHRLHPYLGKFTARLVEELLRRPVRPGGHVLDPSAGSGTTLVQALDGGHDATGVDIAAFNFLLMR
jgi:DNA modification methylase